MNFSRVKPESVFNFFKCISSVVSAMLSASNSLKAIELIENELENTSQKYSKILLFARLIVNVLNPHYYIILLMMSHQSANFGVEGS